MAGRQRGKGLRLRAVTWPRFLRAPEAQLLEALYVPALRRALRYDRCCAYFSSRVLAVAARGFGGLIENLLALGDAAPKPSVRLLVNEQLDARDLSALLATGDQTKLTEKLLKQLKSPKEALERNRLEMLAWLVATGLLEVKVGLMRHTSGLAHAKFGLITDAVGDTLAFMGSDNETGEALVENYEELELRASWKDKEFADYYRDRFEALWEDRDEQVLTLPLPEAVKLELIKLAPEQPPKELTQDAPALEAAALWRYIAASPYLPNGEYACDATAPVDLWPHQRRVVEDTAAAFPSGRLLCDEVGMGKTIEAILVLRRLLAGRGVKRALLLVPAGLLRQWQDELREKGGLLVPRWEDGYLCRPDGERAAVEARQALAENDIILLSREWARLEGNREAVLAAPAWDLALLDEAHAARRSSNHEREFNSANLLLQLLRELQLRGRARGLLLLSATPMQTQPWEPWDLLSTLGVGGEWVVEFEDLRQYYRGVSALRHGPTDREAAATIAHLVTEDSSFPSLGNAKRADAASLRDALRFAPNSKCRAYSDWLRRNSPLGQRMHRNTRDTLRGYYQQGLLDSPPPRREVKDEVFDYQQQDERGCYDAVADYIDERYNTLEKEKPGKGFVMTVYRRRAASSPRALLETLQRRHDGLEGVIRKAWMGDWSSSDLEQLDPRDLSDAGIEERVDPALPSSPKTAAAEKDEVVKLLGRLRNLGGVDSKFDRFWSVLQDTTGDGRSALVFTEYVDTLKHLRDRMVPTYGGMLGCFSGEGGEVWENGQWTSVTKADITERLACGDLKVLLCTDAASEGLNLQAASALINYDLPWNPSKVEQRIGRIDRIGQRQQVLPIRNLFLRDSIDMRVYQALRERCGLFEHFVGRMQPVLALAREALRSNPRQRDADNLIAALSCRAQEVEADETVASAFSSAEAAVPTAGAAPVTRRDLEESLESLSHCNGKVRAKRTKGHDSWRLLGLGGHAVEVTTDRETLERVRHVTPLTATSDITHRLASRLPFPSHLPLVFGEWSSGPVKCVEARWVGLNTTVSVRTLRQLRELLANWDRTPALPARLVAAQDEARAAARQRAEGMQRQAEARERAGLEQQLEACRSRLRRELGRTLRCADSGDLSALLRQQAQREPRPDGRYRRAWSLLDGAPLWTADEIRAIDAFVSELSPKDRQARVNLMAEVDAALNDPRWGTGAAVKHPV